MLARRLGSPWIPSAPSVLQPLLGRGLPCRCIARIAVGGRTWRHTERAWPAASWSPDIDASHFLACDAGRRVEGQFGCRGIRVRDRRHAARCGCCESRGLYPRRKRPELTRAIEDTPGACDRGRDDRHRGGRVRTLIGHFHFRFPNLLPPRFTAGHPDFFNWRMVFAAVCHELVIVAPSLFVSYTSTPGLCCGKISTSQE